MDNDRQSKLAAILSRDVQQLRILKFGLPDIRTFHKESNTDSYYDESGNPVTKPERDKDKHLFPAGYITAIVVNHPIGTDVPALLKKRKNSL